MKAEEFYKQRSNSIRELWALSPKQIEYIALIMEEYAALCQPPVRRSCSFCQFFQHEEIGDSDFGGVYAENATCSKYLDTDKKTEEEIPNFDRNLERDCCKLDFWRVLEIDNVLSEKLAEESDRTGKMDKTYELFKERYNYA